MQSLFCPNCGASNSEFDSECAACGVSLATLIEGVGPPGGGGGNRKAPPAGFGDEDGDDGDELHAGQEISHFRILGRLGRGGMGTVYRALDLELNREVALKFLRPERQRRKQDLARLQREAEALAKLDHPNIGTIYHVDQWQGQRFLAMALYDGETLAEHLAKQPEHRLPVAEAIRIASQLAAALQAAQGAGLVHRDLKPENVIILPDGWVKLIDFGLARWAGSPRQTEQGMVVGTILYMGPEQIRSEEAIPQTDLWALGVVLYEMLAGRHPFHGKGWEIGNSILYDKPFPLRKACPQVPANLEKIVDRCLAKEIKDRWASAADVLAELQKAVPPDSGAGIPVPPRAAWRSWKISVPVALLLIGAAIAAYFLLRPSRPEYVAVLQPEITGSLPPDDQARVKVNLRAALLRTVALLDGLVALDPSQVDAVQGTPLFVARHVGADEIIKSQVYCDGDNCLITLIGLNGQTARDEWPAATEDGLHPSMPKRFAAMATDLLRNKYGNRELRVPRLDLTPGDEDYRRYIELLRRNESIAEAPNDLADLLKSIKALRQRAPAFADVYLLEASVSRRLHDSSKGTVSLDPSIAITKQAQKLAPGDPRLLKILSDLYTDAGLYREAGTVLDQLAKVDRATSLFRQSQLAERQGRPGEALKLKAEATRLHPSVNTFLYLANFEYQQGHMEEARDHYKEALRLEPGNLSGIKGLNQIEVLVNPRQAVKWLREAVKRDPGPDSLINLGVSLLSLHLYNEAEGYLRRALDLSPDDPSAALNLADCLLLLNRPQEANEYYSKVATLTENTTSTNDWQRLSVRAQALAHIGKTQEAEITLQAALSVAPGSPQVACEAAEVYVILGRQDLAIFHAKRAAAGGATAYCLRLPLFGPLRQNPDFQKLLKALPPTQ